MFWRGTGLYSSSSINVLGCHYEKSILNFKQIIWRTITRTTLKSIVKFGASLDINRLHFQLIRLRVIDYKKNNRFVFLKHLSILTKFSAYTAKMLEEQNPKF